MFEKIKEIIKPKKYPCIVWDGKCMKYLSLTKKEIEKIENDPEKKDWSITVDESKI